jgi:hypothetical protein
MSIDTSSGSYYTPGRSREGDRTPALKTQYIANTQGAVNDADHTLGALALSGTSDFVITNITVSIPLMTSTANYNVLVANDTVCSLRGANNSSEFRSIDFGYYGLAIKDMTSTTVSVQFVSSNAAATASNKTLLVQGHYI